MSRSRVPSRSPLGTPLGAHWGYMTHLMGLKLVRRIHCNLICHQRVRHCADTENAQEVERIQTSQRTSCQRALPALRGVTFCADRKLPKSCPGETLCVVLPHAKAALPLKEPMNKHKRTPGGIFSAWLR